MDVAFETVQSHQRSFSYWVENSDHLETFQSCCCIQCWLQFVEVEAEAVASLSVIVFVLTTIVVVEIGCQLVAGFAEVDLAVDKRLVESPSPMVLPELLVDKLSHQPGLFQFVRSLKQR